MHSTRVLLSLRPGRLGLAKQVPAGIELKLDRGDEGIVTGERGLEGVLADHGIPREQLVSVHPPPGTRDRPTDTTITAGNVGRIVRFNDTQLRSVSPAFVVFHTVRRFDVQEQLLVLQDVAAKVTPPIAVETPPGSSYWSTPEEHAFFAHAAARADTPWYLTVDSYHLDGASATGLIDADSLETVRSRGSEARVTEAALDRFENAITERAATAQVPPIGELRGDPWLSTLRTLVLAGDAVRSIHLNDPATDGVPSLDRVESVALQAIFELCVDLDIYVVLEPDDYDPETLRAAVTAVQQALGDDSS